MSAINLQRLAEVTRLYFDVARLKRGPEDLPAVRSLMVATIIAYAFLSLVLGMMLPPQSAHPLALILIDVALMLAWVKLLLQLARKPERYVQTTMAIFGFQLVIAPPSAVGMGLFLRLRDDPAWELPVSLLILALGIWALVVNARILHAATQWPQFACVGLVLVQALVARGILLAIFPEAAAAT